MTAQNSIEEIVFHPQGEKGAIKFCRNCQVTPHYCNALVCRPDLKGCLEYYWSKTSKFPDGKTLKWFLPFTVHELARNRLYTTEEYEQRLEQQRRNKPTSCFTNWSHPQENRKCEQCLIQTDCWSETVAKHPGAPTQ